MRIERLVLRAFGAFSGRELAFDPRADLQIVFGANEAGKSTTLRAVTSLLFGFDARSGDAWIHDYRALRVGASLRLADGTALSLMRRKGNRNTLFAFDPDSGEELGAQPLADDVLDRALAGLDRALFRQLYGLDIDDLEQGGQALLDGQGEVGRSLFQAAAGLANLQQVMGSLEQQRAALYRPRASTSTIQQTLRAWEEQVRQARELTVRTQTWLDADRGLREARQRLEAIRARHGERRAHQQALLRLRACVPLMQRYRHALDELSALGELPALAPDAADLRVRAQQRLAAAGAAREQAAAEIEVQQRALADAPADAATLAAASRIEALRHAADGRREAESRLATLAAERDNALSDLSARLERMAPGVAPVAAATLLPEAPLLARVDALALREASLGQRAAEIVRESSELAALTAALEEDLARLPATVLDPGLALVCEAAAAAGDVDARAEELQRIVAAEREALVAQAAAFSDLGLDRLLGLALPLDAELDASERELGELESTRLALERERESIARDRSAVEADLQRVAAVGAVTTRADVEHARSVRDAHWNGVRAAAGAGRLSPELAERFEQSIEAADTRADAFASNASQAAHVGVQRARLAEMDAAIMRLERRAQQTGEAHAAAELRWQRLVAPLGRGPIAPAAAREWLKRRELLAQNARRLAQRADEATRALAVRDELRQRLAAALRAAGLDDGGPHETVAAAVRRAGRAIEVDRDAQARRSAIEQRLADARARRQANRDREAALQADLDQWRRDWGQAMRVLRLREDALVEEANARRGELETIAALLERLTGIDAQQAVQRATLADFDARLAAVCGTLAAAPAPDGDPAVRAEALYERLQRERERGRRAQLAQAALETARRRQSQAEAELSAAHAELETLCARAQVREADELPVVEDACRRQRQWRETAAASAALLVETGQRPLDALLAEPVLRDPEQLDASIAAAETELDELQHALEAASNQWQMREVEFGRIDGSDAAVLASQQAHEHRAELAAQVRDYARTRLAACALDRVIRSYRERHQGPLIERAGGLFATITGQRYRRLVVDHDGESQVLLGELEDGARVAVPAMSQGTRHQLFLALRVAAIERQVAAREPVPVIVDDLLVQFDDERSAATLRVLAELGRSTQVIFFTHHAHLLDIAAAALAPGRFAVQRL